MTNNRLDHHATGLMIGALLLASPLAALAADDVNTATAQDQQTAQAMPPAPQGPFFSRSQMGNFPPMGFDPMTHRNPAVVQDGSTYNSNVDGNVRGSGDIDVQIRGRIGMSGGGVGNGYGNQGWGNGFAPYGMPFNHGYGAPYGTPFNQAFAQPQAPQGDTGTAQNAMPQMPQTMPQQGGAPFSWDPKVTTGQTAQPAQMPQAPQPPEEPEWVKQQREQMEQRQAEAQERMAEMQKNTPYPQQQSGYAPSYAQGYPQPYAQPYGQGYGAPYGAPFMNPYAMPYGAPYGYARQPQSAPAQ